MFAQDLESLRCLLGEEFLLATSFAKISQIPCRVFGMFGLSASSRSFVIIGAY